MPTEKEKLKFATIVQEYIDQRMAGNYLDAIMLYCQKHQMEPEVAANLIGKPLKAKIAANARELNLIPKTGKLPI